MATQGPNLTGTGADSAAVGTFAWQNPSQITSDDGTPARCLSPNGLNNISHYLKATNFGFSIPAGATINGITVVLAAIRAGSANSISDHEAKIVKSDGSIGSTNKSTGTNFNTIGTYNVTYGGSSDLWGETWTDADINDSDFGFVLSVSASKISKTTQRLDINSIKITVDYTSGGGGGSQQEEVIIQFN